MYSHKVHKVKTIQRIRIHVEGRDNGLSVKVVVSDILKTYLNHFLDKKNELFFNELFVTGTIELFFHNTTIKYFKVNDCQMKYY